MGHHPLVNRVAGRLSFANSSPIVWSAIPSAYWTVATRRILAKPNSSSLSMHRSRPDSIAVLSHPFLSSIGANEDKLLRRFRQLLNGKQRQQSSIGAKLKDITDKAQRAISRSNSPSSTPRLEEELESSTTQAEADDDSSVVLNREDGGSGYSTAVIRSEFDATEGDLADDVVRSAEPGAAIIDNPDPVTETKPDLRPSSSNQIIVFAVAIVVVVLAAMLHWAR